MTFNEIQSKMWSVITNVGGRCQFLRSNENELTNGKIAPETLKLKYVENHNIKI